MSGAVPLFPLYGTMAWRQTIYLFSVFDNHTDNVTYVIPRRKWEDNIRINLQEVGSEGMDWIELAQDQDRWRALVNAVMNLRIP